MADLYGFKDRRVAEGLRDFYIRRPVETVPPTTNKRRSAAALTAFVLAEDVASATAKTVMAWIGLFTDNTIDRDTTVSDPIDLFNSQYCLGADTKLARAGHTGVMAWIGSGWQIVALYGCIEKCTTTASITDPSIPSMSVDSVITPITITVTGGNGTTTVTGLPDGLSFAGSATGGTITGTPTKAGTSWVQVVAQSAGCPRTKLFKFKVDE